MLPCGHPADEETGELTERKLVNGDGEAERFYCELEAPALVGTAIQAFRWLEWIIQSIGRDTGTRCCWEAK